MTGAHLRTLMTALNVGCTELGREVGVSKQAIRFNQRSGKLKAETEARLVDALEIVASRRGADRERAQTERLLELAGAD